MIRALPGRRASMPAMRRTLLVLALIVSSATAHAGEKSRQTARLSSGVAASIAGGVVLSGFLFAEDGRPFNMPVLYTGLGLLFIAPSAGEFYAEQYLTYGMAVRAAALGLAVYTLDKHTKPVTCQDALSSDQPKCEGFKEAAYPLMGVAAIMFIGGVWYDVLDAGDAADRYNRNHGLTVTPTALAAPHGMVPAVALSGTF